MVRVHCAAPQGEEEDPVGWATRWNGGKQQAATTAATTAAATGDKV